MIPVAPTRPRPLSGGIVESVKWPISLSIGSLNVLNRHLGDEAKSAETGVDRTPG